MSCSNYAGALNIPWYNYNRIVIIVANVIMLEFLSARFLHLQSFTGYLGWLWFSCGIVHCGKGLLSVF